MRIKEIKLYKFDELEDKAKEVARQWFREGALDYEWWDSIYEDATRMGELMGLDIKKIYFSGFSSQGDGACFEGSWYASNVKPGEVKKEAPVDKELHRIAQEFERLAAYGLSFTVKQSGHYMHKYCTSFDISVPDEIEDTKVNELEEALKENARDYMEWIYRTLEKEHDWMLEDAQIEDSIRANEYEFTIDGGQA